MNTLCEKYTPDHLKLWTRPDCYAGAQWPEWFPVIGQNRDSGALDRANFDATLKALGGQSETVLVIRESHWAVGWVEWIGVHQSDSVALRTADDIKGALEQYPVVDEFLFSEYEQTEANEVWLHCYRAAERVEYIRKHRAQFEFRGLADMLQCIRGKFFSGYSSELLN